MSRTAVIGCRNFNDYTYMKSILDKYEITEVISGAARGADKLAEVYALENNLPTKIFPADWGRYGPSAGFIRNKEIIDNADQVIAFWDNISKGTKNSIDLATESNKPLLICTGWKEIKPWSWHYDNPLMRKLSDSKIPKLVIG